jgi:hypothetical protein
VWQTSSEVLLNADQIAMLYGHGFSDGGLFVIDMPTMLARRMRGKGGSKVYLRQRAVFAWICSFK